MAGDNHGPRLEFPDRPLPDLVADHARRDPDSVAVRQWDETMTYRRLVATAGEVAALVRGRNRARGSNGTAHLVGVCADRHPAMVAGLLGVLAAGAGYVPLDPGQPVARLRAMVRAAGLRTVVCDPAGADLLSHPGLDLVPLPRRVDAAPPTPPGTGGAVSYAMFTSGSTGTPKGVLIGPRALAESVTGIAAIAGLDRTSRMLGFASIGFDASVIDLLAPLAAGGTVALAGTADRADPVRLQRFCVAHEVSVAFLPPAILPVLDPTGLPALRVVLTGAEAPGPEQVARWTDGGRRFVNCYGPTEATVMVTWFEASGRWDGPLPIGRPVPNHRVYVVDSALRPVGVGVPGELLAGGPGLALGYLGDPALTAERFVPDRLSGLVGERLYRTGDLVAWQPDGNLAFLGRTDRQVKVRGQRVEIGEVEAMLRGHPGVGHATVAAVPAPDGGLALVAFVTAPTGPPDSAGPPDPAGVRAYCAERLPAAMVPARVAVVPDLPLGPTGKVDVDRLVAALPPQPGWEAAPAAGSEVTPAAGDDGFRPPATPAEESVAACWAEVLGRVRVGRDDDFFDSGGHSITAMRLVTALRARLDRDVSIEDILAGRTLRAVAARASAAAPLGGTGSVRGRAPALSPAQQRLWFLDRFAPAAASAYNIGLAERLRGPLDVAALGAALDAVAGRHEVLRWRLVDAGGTPRAVVDPPGPVPLPVDDLSGLDAAAREPALAARLAADARELFGLATDPLWRARLYRLGPEHHVLAVTAHHAVFDGWSQALLYTDLAAAYRQARATGPNAPDLPAAPALPALPAAPALPALPATYADYVAWRAERDTQRGADDIEWWLTELDGVPATVALPTDRPRPAEQSFAGAYTGRWIDADTTAAVGRLARGLGATPPAVLLAALGVVLARRTGQPDLVIGSPMVDRRHADFEDMIGFFVEIAPLRVRVDGTATFADQVRASRDVLLAALAHPAAPLERLVRDLGLGGDLARSPLVQVLFNMFNFAAPRLDLPDLVSETVPVEVPGSPFDLTVYGVERAGRLRIEAVYNPDLFAAETMTGLLAALHGVVERGVAAPGTVVVDLLEGEPLDGTREGPRAHRRAEPTAPGTASTEPPVTATERAVARVWCEVLGRTAVDATASFFDSGGTSVAIVAVQHRLNRLLGRDLRVVDLFRYPTVRTLAAHLDAAGPAPAGGPAKPDAAAASAVERAARRGAARRARHARTPTAGPEGVAPR